jgi:uncharacterized membrane protein YfcA
MSFIIGLLSGIFGGLVGLGGGVIMIPMMVGILKLEQRKAHGTSLIAIVFTGITGAAIYAVKGNIDIMAAALLAVTAIFTIRYGAKFAHAMPEWKLKKSFGAFLLFVSAIFLLKPYLVGDPRPVEMWIKIPALLATGAFTGFLSGMMGVGGGAIMVPAMALLAGLSQYTAQGSSLLAVVPIAIAGAHTHWKLGNTATKLLPGLIIGVLLGTYLGSAFALDMPENILRIIFCSVVVFTGIKYLGTKRQKSLTENIDS